MLLSCKIPFDTVELEYTSITSQSRNNVLAFCYVILIKICNVYDAVDITYTGLYDFSFKLSCLDFLRHSKK